MSVQSRRQTLAEAVRGGNQVSIRQLAANLGCSEMTIRRDLDALARAGVLHRVHGSAVGVSLRADEVPYAVRVFEAAAAKERIGRAVADLIADGETVALDSGTTAAAVAHALRGRSITLLPLGLRTLVDLAHDEHIHLIAPGGDVRPGELVVTGDLAEVAFERLHFDTFILGCCGIDEENGVTTHVPADARIKRAALASARRTIAIADATKLGAVAFGHVSPLSAIERLVTDARAEQSFPLESAGLRVDHV
ncbi:MAG TPA: DeoR/GlpR family DNA-binding transcription regulator [Acidimicrobiales bacterium]